MEINLYSQLQKEYTQEESQINWLFLIKKEIQYN